MYNSKRLRVTKVASGEVISILTYLALSTGNGLNLKISFTYVTLNPFSIHSYPHLFEDLQKESSINLRNLRVPKHHDGLRVHGKAATNTILNVAALKSHL